MINGEIKARLIEDPMCNLRRLYVLRYANDKTFSITLNEKGEYQELEMEQGRSDWPPCLFTIRGNISSTILPAIVEALADKGFDRPSESTLRGKCEAMSAHLEDMRTLLKLGGSTRKNK